MTPPNQSDKAERGRARAKANRPAANKGYLKDKFIELYRQMRAIGAAAEALGTTQRTIKRWRDSDPAFAEKFEEVDLNVTDELKRRTLERAIDGVPVSSYQDGKLVVIKREYSDRLAELHLKQRDPSFRDRVQVDIVNKVAARVVSEIVEVIRSEVQDVKLVQRIRAALDARLGTIEEVQP